MRVLRLCVVLLLCAGLRAQGPAVPQAVAVRNEPHHHLAFENSYVRVFSVEVAPHAATLLHEHARDYFYVTLGAADIINAPLGKPGTHAQSKDGEVHFARGGFAHVAQNLSDQPFRNLTIEFLRPQGEARNLCEKVVPGDVGPCEKAQGKGFAATPLFETAEVRVEFVRLDPQAQKVEMVAGTGTLVAALEQAGIKVESEGQPPVSLATGGLVWLPAGSRQVFSNLRNTPSSFLRIAFKDSNAQPALAH
jgi:hypothetical protein